MARTHKSARKATVHTPQKKNLVAKAKQPAARKAPVGKHRRRVLFPWKIKARRRQALREIRQYQKGSELLKRPIKESIVDLRSQASAMETAEAMRVQERKMVNLAAIHAGRVTSQVEDMELIRCLRKIMTGTG